MRTTQGETLSFTTKTENEKPPPAYFLSLTVENFKCFAASQTLDLSDGNGRPRQWTILLGDNGVGKTTLLQCLAGLQPYSQTRSENGDRILLPTVFRRYYLEAVYQAFSVSSDNPFEIKANIFWNAPITGQGEVVSGWYVSGNSNSSSTQSIKQNIGGLICYSYGASRRMGTTDLSESQNEDTIANLFDDNATLINAEEWLLQADYAAKSLEGKSQTEAEKRRERIKELLIKLLPDVSDLRFVPTETPPIRTTVQAKTPYGWVSITQMSLGYRTLMTWMVDFASRLFERYPDSPNPLAEPAIALVDEIDLHLHPRWQRTLMQFLSETFPNTQFIVSAHSPLVVQSAENANVVLLRREGDQVVIDNSLKAIRNWRVDQVLTSDLFGLESARPPQTAELLEERTRLLSKANLTAKDKTRLRKLEAEIGSLPTGETPQDIEAMDIIRRAAELLKN